MSSSGDEDRDMLGDSLVAFGTSGQVPGTSLLTEALARVPLDAPGALDATVVDRFCDRLRDSARYLNDSGLLEHPTDRADAFHYLLTTIAGAVQYGTVQADPLEPMFSPPMATHQIDWGARCPDGVYRHAAIRDDASYRIRGRLGNAKYFTLEVSTATYVREQAHAIGDEDLVLDDDGNFEIFVGGEERTGQQWFPMPTGGSKVLVREFFDDWAAARRTVLRIDCLDDLRTPVREPSAARVAAEWDVVGDWVFGAGVRFWLRDWHSDDYLVEARNAFMNAILRADTKRPTVTRGCWTLAPDEALIVEFPDLHARYWGLQLASVLVHTLDFANRLTTCNNAQAHLDDDGVYRLVVAHDDPGIHNWLDTTGLEHGEVILRFHRADTPSIPTTRVVKQREVAGLLPNARRCSPEERRVQLADRRDGVARLLCD